MLAALPAAAAVDGLLPARWVTTAKQAHDGGTVHGCCWCCASRKAQVLVQQKSGIFHEVYGTIERKKEVGKPTGT